MVSPVEEDKAGIESCTYYAQKERYPQRSTKSQNGKEEQSIKRERVLGCNDLTLLVDRMSVMSEFGPTYSKHALLLCPISRNGQIQSLLNQHP